MLSLDHKNNRGEAPHGVIYLAGLKCYFSYDTIVAVQSPDGLFYLPNEWGPTTGKHMNRMFNRALGKEVTSNELTGLIKGHLVRFGLEYVRDRIEK